MTEGIDELQDRIDYLVTKAIELWMSGEYDLSRFYNNAATGLKARLLEMPAE